MKGILYWITGLAGAGKTTIGNALYYNLKEKQSNIILLDGDILKEILGNDLGYAKEDRLIRAKRYSSLCKMLVDQGMTAIICTIAMFDEVRDWNRENIENYVEVFLDVPIDILRERDRKGLYSKQSKGDISNLVGIDLEVEFPKTPDLILKNDNSLSLSECVKRIKDVSVKSIAEYNRDTAYWDEIYKDSKIKIEPSKFALEMIKFMEKGKSLIDLGCGNGRDSIFFLEKGLRVTAIDASSGAINLLQSGIDDKKAVFICDDFVTSRAVFQQQYDYCYSRFSLHAINVKQESQMLSNVHEALKDGGKLFIEARSIKDSIYGLGKNVEYNAFIYNEHYRRFIDKEELQEKLDNMGFEILAIEENNGFAPYLNEDPILIRVIATKKQVKS